MAKFLKGMYKPAEKMDNPADKAYDKGSTGKMARSNLLAMSQSFPALKERPSSEAVRYGKGAPK